MTIRRKLFSIFTRVYTYIGIYDTRSFKKKIKLNLSIYLIYQRKSKYVVIFIKFIVQIEIDFELNYIYGENLC